ncbi:MAG: hypothetical protein IKL33_03495, partial [Alphaproteobacteria bacterium]|nr:hypothetical protein [Alphaproteobacteria bacterium]
MANKGTSGQHGPAAQSIRLSATEGANKGFSKNLNEKVSSFIKPTAKPTIMPTLKQPIPQPQPQNRVVIPLRPGETLEKQGTTPFLKQPQNTTEGGNNVAPDTPETQETEKEVTVNEAPQTKKTRDDYDNMTDAEKEAFNVDDADDDLKKFLEDQKQSEQSNNDRTAGEISKRQHDEDEREDDDDKFEIKEGDFIDFLMKEIVLASAAYVGKKVAGGANYLLYKSGSWVYHDVLGKGVDKTIQFGEDTYKAIKQRHKEIQENSGKYHIPLTVIEGASSEELSKLYKEHNKAIDEIMKKDVSGIALANMFKEVISNGELKNYSHPIWVDPETGKKINVEKDQYAKAAIAISKQIHENTKEMDLSPKQKENYFNN